MISGVKSRLKCYALHVIFKKCIQNSIRNKLFDSNFSIKKALLHLKFIYFFKILNVKSLEQLKY